MQIDLSRIAETHGQQPLGKCWNHHERSSASYGAKHLGNEVYVLFRYPADGAEYVLLGKCNGTAKAERRLQWWVANDSRVVALIRLAELRDTALNLLDLIMESASA